MKFFAIILYLTILLGCKEKELKQKSEGSITPMKKSKIETLGDIKLTAEQEKFILDSLSKGDMKGALKEVSDGTLRLVVEEVSDQDYTLHIGSSDPYNGGSGGTYILNKKTGDLTLDYHEDYAPVPDFDKL